MRLNIYRKYALHDHFSIGGNDGKQENVSPFLPSYNKEKRLQDYTVRRMNLHKDIE